MNDSIKFWTLKVKLEKSYKLKPKFSIKIIPSTRILQSEIALFWLRKINTILCPPLSGGVAAMLTPLDWRPFGLSVELLATASGYKFAYAK